MRIKRNTEIGHKRFCLLLNNSGNFIVILPLYGTREDTTIWAKIISAHAKKCSRMEVYVAEGRWVGQKANSEQTSWGMNAYKYSAQYPWVLRGSLEEKYANLCSTRRHFGAIISMKQQNAQEWDVAL